MFPLEDCDGVVLAGGRSRRMGEDKYGLAWPNGPTLGEYQRRQLAQCVRGRVWVARGRHPLTRPEELPDPEPGEGPLAGILAAMEVSTASRLAVVPVDVPGAAPAAFFWLGRAQEADLAHGGLRLVVAQAADGRLQPLVGLWPVALRAGLYTYLAQGGRRVVEFVERQDPMVVRLPPSIQLVNLNTPAELKAYLRRYQGNSAD
jgi:molybdopterin-guanine dinucleotide biosynthesis protein A